MKALFVDTSGWANLFDKDEPFHVEAKKFVDDARKKKALLVTTNYVVAELVSLLTSPFRVSRPQTIKYIESIKKSRSVEIIHIDKVLDQRAWDLLSKRDDKNWSLVDCTTFVLMQDKDIAEALTEDHHFEQAGLIRLLK